MNLRKGIATVVVIGLFLSILISVKEVEPTTRGENAHFIVGLEGIGNPLNLTSRATIYSFIQNNPGAHLRQVCNKLNISIGSAQYHLERLVEGDLLESEKESKYRRFFVSRRYSDFEKTLISLLNRHNTRRIIELVIATGGVSHQKLASEVGVTSQAITWQVQRLIEKQVVRSFEVEGRIIYYATEIMVEAYSTFLPTCVNLHQKY